MTQNVSDRWLGLAIGTLVTWRVTRMLVAEDGPGQVISRLRSAVDRTPLVGLLDCFGCASVWVGAATALAVVSRPGRAGRPVDVALTGVALSGSAFVLQQLLTHGDAPAWLPEPEVDSPLIQVVPG